MGLLDFLFGLFGGGSDGDEGEGDDPGGPGGPPAGGDRSEDDDEDVKDVSEYGPADFRREAEEFAADHEEEDLDFSLSSLERLDDYAASQTEILNVLGDEVGEDNELVGGMREGYVLWFGSYFGEVLVRQFDGEWVRDEDGVAVAVPAGDELLEVPALDVAVAAVTDEPPFAETAAELRDRIERAEADPGGDGAGAGGGSGAPAGGPVEAPAGDAGGIPGSTTGDPPELPTVEIEPGADLDATHERVVAAFEEAGYHVTRGDLMNSVSGPLSGVAKLFNFYTDEAMYTGVVYTGEWDEAATNGVLTLASNLRTDADLGMNGLYVVAAEDPPEGVTYLTGSHPRGAFALEAMVELQNGPEFGPDTATEYAELGAELLAKYFDLEIADATRESLASLDDLVLTHLRTVDDEHRPEEGYVPREALVTVGCLAGEIYRRALERELPVSVRWTAAPDVSSTGVALAVEGPDGGEATVNPVGKSFKLFEAGSEDSLEFMYRTTERVVRDDLS